MKQISTLIFLSIFALVFFSCARNVNKETQKTKADSEMNTKTTAGPPVLIYKTNKDYYQHVPIVLNDDKSRIISYPDIKDVVQNNTLAYPTRLENGYLMDNRGINENAAFLNITYKEYSKLAKTPSIDELKAMILDDNPFIELYFCGSRYDYNDVVTELNAKIANNELSGFKKLK